MSNFNFDSLVDLLIKATDNNKLGWQASADGRGYSAKVGKCTVTLTSDYDSSIGINEYDLLLFNAKGERFESFSYNETAVEYSKLNRLYDSIRDGLYHITESERDIMDTLTSISEQIDADDTIPF